MITPDPQKIKDTRKKRKLTQQALVNKISLVSEAKYNPYYQVISKLEDTKKIHHSLELVSHLCNALDIEPNELFKEVKE
jgi:transcriptional regulator with XRE-family HTH domain